MALPSSRLLSSAAKKVDNAEWASTFLMKSFDNVDIPDEITAAEKTVAVLNEMLAIEHMFESLFLFKCRRC